MEEVCSAPDLATRVTQYNIINYLSSSWTFWPELECTIDLLIHLVSFFTLSCFDDLILKDRREAANRNEKSIFNRWKRWMVTIIGTAACSFSLLSRLKADFGCNFLAVKWIDWRKGPTSSVISFGGTIWARSHFGKFTWVKPLGRWSSFGANAENSRITKFWGAFWEKQKQEWHRCLIPQDKREHVEQLDC